MEETLTKVRYSRLFEGEDTDEVGGEVEMTGEERETLETRSMIEKIRNLIWVINE